MSVTNSSVFSRVLRFLVKLVLGFVGFVLLVGVLAVVAVGIENLRGSRAWSAVKREHEAAGDSLSIEAVIPAQVPPESNFAETPLLKPLLAYRPGEKQPSTERAAAEEKLKQLSLGDTKGMADRLPDGRVNLAGWQQYFAGGDPGNSRAAAGSAAEEVLAGLQKWDAALNELEAASLRPAARFDIHYKEGFNALLPHLARLKGLLLVYELRSAALLGVGNTGSALKDIQTAERIAASMDGEPLLISMLVEYAGQTFVTRMAWQGLVDHRWNAAQLERLQAQFAGRPDPLRRFASAIKGERAFAVAAIDPNRGNMAEVMNQLTDQNGPQMNMLLWAAPRGWLRQNQITLVRFYDEALRSPHTSANQIVSAETGENGPESIKDRFLPYSVLAKQLVAAISNAEMKSFRMLAVNRMSVIACALERYRIVNGAYPRMLEDLVPQFLAAIPIDPANGGVFSYHPEDGWYHLVSSGPPAFRSGRRNEKPEVAWEWPSPKVYNPRLF